ncbi:MAG: hypothetical protein ACE5GA_06795 [Candidatus Zixiibacteriota bacterium]
MRLTALLTLLFAVSALRVSAQTSVNPDFSVIGDFRAFSHNDRARPRAGEDISLADPQMELDVSGYLNPYMRAALALGWHGEERAEIEEVYLTILRGLPLGANFRAGRYLLEFGRLNPVHEHAWSFLNRPLAHEVFFGDEGLADMAFRVSFLLPTGDVYTELMIAGLKGDALLDEDERAAISDGADENRPGFFGRLATSLAVGETSELALGVSALNSVYNSLDSQRIGVILIPAGRVRAWVGGLDIKYRHAPSRYRTLQIEAEALFRSDAHTVIERASSFAGYGYIDYRFSGQYNLGGVLEYLSHETFTPPSSSILGTVESSTWRTGLFVGFSPVEETSVFRLAGHWTNPENAGGFWEAQFQIVIGLGPHKTHNF